MDTPENRHPRLRLILECEALEERVVPATAVLVGTALTVTGGPGDERIRIYSDGTSLHVLSGTVDLGAFALTAVDSIEVDTSPGGNDSVIVAPDLTQQVTLNGQGDTNKLVAGGGPTTLLASGGKNYLFGSTTNTTTYNASGTQNDLFNVFPDDVVFPSPGNQILPAYPPGSSGPSVTPLLTTSDVNALLQRAAAASATTDAIIAVVDRNGNILGVRVESGVSTAITGNVDNLVFAVDGAVSLARTGAFFANDQAPLTSRTVEFISQSTITQREVESNPSITDPNSTLAGPGFVAPVGIGGHFPPGINDTPDVDLFNIEYSNRDTSILASGQIEADRFNIDTSYVPQGAILTAPNSYGYVTGLEPNAQPRGIATLPGGIPIYKDGQVVGGIGVFFPGTTGYATAENSSLSATYNPTLPDLSLEAEWMAFAAVGGATVSVDGSPTLAVGTLGGIAVPAGFGLPTGRIDLVGIQLPTFGPGGSVQGPQELARESAAVGRGNPNDGTDLPVTAGPDPSTLLPGTAVPSGWLVTPHDGVGITAAQVTSIITQGLIQADQTRAQIRLPIGVPAQFVFAVADKDGNIVGLYREPDATVFSIDVAVAKARNVAYYDDASELQAVDQLPGVAAGTAFTARTFRFLAEPLYPEGIDGSPPGYFSILNDDPGIDPKTGLETEPPLPAIDYYGTVSGYAAFNPRSNFHDPYDLDNQNGVVFFPGSAAIYAPGSKALIGGLGVSGDGVAEDDVVTVSAEAGYNAPQQLRSDNIAFRGILLPYQQFNRNPEL
jgi:uncharacterized protein GlcG (DUF336 family)